MSDIKNTIAKASRMKGEDNDCTVRALAVMLDGDYDRAHAVLEAEGRKPKRGPHHYMFLDAFEKVGLRLQKVTPNFDGLKTIAAVEKDLRLRGDTKRYIFSVDGHVAAWDGKETVDWAAGRLHRIQNIYLVLAKGERKIPVKVLEKEPQSSLSDVVFIIHKEGKNGDYRIMIRENGNIRWLNSAWDIDDAEWKATVASNRRYIGYAGELESADDLEDHYDRRYW